MKKEKIWNCILHLTTIHAFVCYGVCVCVDVYGCVWIGLNLLIKTKLCTVHKVWLCVWFSFFNVDAFVHVWVWSLVLLYYAVMQVSVTFMYDFLFGMHQMENNSQENLYNNSATTTTNNNTAKKSNEKKNSSNCYFQCNLHSYNFFCFCLLHVELKSLRNNCTQHNQKKRRREL